VLNNRVNQIFQIN